MSFSITETDVWPRVARAIAERRAEIMNDLLHVPTLERMRQLQGNVEALDWVIAESKPKPQPKSGEREE